MTTGAHGLETALAQRDIPAIDLAIARAFKKLDLFRKRLARGEKDLADPIAEERPIAGKIAFERLSELLKGDELARIGAQRHVAELCFFRLAREAEEEMSNATHAPFDRFARKEMPSTFAESARALLGEHDERERRSHLDVMMRASSDIAAHARERDAIRVEASSRLGLPHPIAFATESSTAQIEDAARTFLQQTEGLFFDVIARRAKKAEREWSLYAALDLARGLDANEGWPARLQQGFFGEAIPALAKFAPNKKRPLTMVGASTFLLDLALAGEELRKNTAPKSLAFVVAHDPHPRAAFRLGQIFAMLGAHAPFHKRVLGLSPGPARDQSVKLAESALLLARVQAVRVLFALRAPSASDFEELSRAAFGVPCDPKLRGAWPLPKLDTPTRFLATLEANETFDELVQKFDEDWFRNPRAGREIMSRASGPMRDVAPSSELTPHALRLVRSLEQALK